MPRLYVTWLIHTWRALIMCDVTHWYVAYCKWADLSEGAQPTPCVWVCVCVYVWVCECVRVCVCVCMFVCEWADLWVGTQPTPCMCACVCIYMWVCEYVHVYMCMFVCVRVCERVCVCMCVCLCCVKIYVCKCVYVCMKERERERVCVRRCGGGQKCLVDWHNFSNWAFSNLRWSIQQWIDLWEYLPGCAAVAAPSTVSRAGSAGENSQKSAYILYVPYQKAI